jgi:hypothetical protein
VATRLLLALALLAVPLQARTDVPAPLTEVETLRIENLRLEGVIIQHELAQWQAKRATLTKDLEASRPGWVYNQETGTFTEKPK